MPSAQTVLDLAAAPEDELLDLAEREDTQRSLPGASESEMVLCFDVKDQLSGDEGLRNHGFEAL